MLENQTHISENAGTLLDPLLRQIAVAFYF